MNNRAGTIRAARPGGDGTPTSHNVASISRNEAPKVCFKDSTSEDKGSNSARRDWAGNCWSAIRVLQVSGICWKSRQEAAQIIG